MIVLLKTNVGLADLLYKTNSLPDYRDMAPIFFNF